MSSSMADWLKTIVGWFWHVPDTYELLWWVLLSVCYYGFSIDRRLRAVQRQLDERPVAAKVD